MHIKRDTKGKLDEGTLYDLSESFGIDILFYKKILNGNMKDTYIINTKNKKYIAQRYKYGDFYLKKFNFINIHLKQLEDSKTKIAYPKFLTTIDGQYFVHGYTLQKFLQGESSLCYTLEKAFSAALALRTFHSFTFDIKEKMTVWKREDPINVDKQIITTAKNYGYGVIHGEFRLRNMLFNGNNVSAILDFDSICYSNRYHDIAYLIADFIENNFSSKDLYIKTIHQAYSSGEINIASAYAALLIHYIDYVKKCETGFLKNNKPLSISEIKRLITFLEDKYYEYIR